MSNELQSDRIQFDEFVACHNVGNEVIALLEKIGLSDPDFELGQEITETIVEALKTEHDASLKKF